MDGTLLRAMSKTYLATIRSRVPRNRSAYCVWSGSKHCSVKHSTTKPLGRLLTVGFSRRHHLLSLTSGLNRPPLRSFTAVVQAVWPGGFVTTHFSSLRSGMYMGVPSPPG